MVAASWQFAWEAGKYAWKHREEIARALTADPTIMLPSVPSEEMAGRLTATPAGSGRKVTLQGRSVGNSWARATPTVIRPPRSLSDRLLDGAIDLLSWYLRFR